jgi:Bacterial membrane protein YfhO
MYVALIIASLLYCPLLFSNLDRYGRNDWDQFSFRYETPRLALLRDHQLPLWNPYVNGGTVLLAHPDSPFPSPWYLLTLTLGAPLGLRVQVVLFMILGATGMAALLRRWNIPAPGSFVGGVIFIMSAHFALQIAEGHLEWCVLGLMPWVMLCLLRFATDLRFVIVAALLLASILTFGSVYILAVYIPFLSVWATLESIRSRSWRVALGWGGTVVLMVLLSAVKLLPQLEFVHDNPRQTKAEGFSPIGLVHVFLDPRQSLLNQATHEAREPHEARERLRLGAPAVSSHEATDSKFENFANSLPEPAAMSIENQLQNLGFDWRWHEYGGYITYLGLLLAACGVAVSWRSQWPLYVAGFVVGIVMLGNGSPIDLWALLQTLPLFDQLRVPSRFMAALVFALAVAAGHGLGWLCRHIVRTDLRSLHVLVRYGIPIAIYVELAALGWNLFGDVFVGHPVQLPYYTHFALRYKTLYSENPRLRGYLYAALKSNSGVLEGYENLQVQRGNVRTVEDPDYKGEVYFENSKDTVSFSEWTMARVRVTFQVDHSDRLILNQNYSKGWRATIWGSAGLRDQPDATDKFGLVSIAIHPGDHEVEFYYLPNTFVTGAFISVITLVSCFVLLGAGSQPRYRDALQALRDT